MLCCLVLRAKNDSEPSGSSLAKPQEPQTGKVGEQCVQAGLLSNGHAGDVFDARQCRERVDSHIGGGSIGSLGQVAGILQDQSIQCLHLREELREFLPNGCRLGLADTQFEQHAVVQNA